MENNISQLAAMGFDPQQARIALEQSGENLEAAANLLLSGQVLGTSSETSPLGDVSMINAPLSQFDLPGGKSACTCIALSIAQSFLSNPDQSIEASLLQQGIIDGNKKYNAVVETLNTNVEHMSAEEVLQTGTFPLEIIGGVHQGMLSRDQKSPLGLEQQLGACQQANEWTVVIITKSPETVAVCLPPKNGGSSSFSLLDSHPRPHLFGGEGAYALIHSDFSGLLQSLQRVFPYTELSPDIPELMAAMYNSFDLYPLTIKSTAPAP